MKHYFRKTIYSVYILIFFYDNLLSINQFFIFLKIIMRIYTDVGLSQIL